MMVPAHHPLAHLNCYDRPTTSPLRATAHGVDPYPGPNDDDAMSSSSSAPVIEGACNCGSPQMQELIYDGRWWVDPYPPDLQVAGMGKVWVWVWVTHGLPMWIPILLCVALSTTTYHTLQPHPEYWKQGFIYPLHCAQTTWPCIHTNAFLRHQLFICLHIFVHLPSHAATAKLNLTTTVIDTTASPLHQHPPLHTHTHWQCL
jgi:hypothetical protein